MKESSVTNPLAKAPRFMMMELTNDKKERATVDWASRGARTWHFISLDWGEVYLSRLGDGIGDSAGKMYSFNATSYS